MKTLTFGLMHVTIAFALVWAITGSPALGGAVALIEPLVNTVGYAVHERLWARRARRPATSDDPVAHELVDRGHLESGLVRT